MTPSEDPFEKDRTAFETWLANRENQATSRVRFFWDKLSRQRRLLPVPIAIREDEAIELSWHQEDRFLDIRIGATGGLEVFYVFGSDAPGRLTCEWITEDLLALLRRFEIQPLEA